MKDFSSRIRKPHLIFSTENPRYSPIEAHTQDQAIQQMNKLKANSAHPSEGKFGGKKEKSIFVSEPNPEQIKLAHHLAHRTGQEAILESDGMNHRNVVFNKHGQVAHIIPSTGTTIHDPKKIPKDDRTSVGDTHFTHTMNFPTEEQYAHPDMAPHTPDPHREERGEPALDGKTDATALGKSESLEKMSQPRMRFPKFGTDPRAEQNVQQIATPRQAKIYGKKVANHAIPDIKSRPYVETTRVMSQDPNKSDEFLETPRMSTPIDKQLERDKYARSNSSKFNRRTLGLNSEASPSVMSGRSAKSFQGSLAGGMRSKHEPLNGEDMQNRSEHATKMGEAWDAHHKKVAHWRKNGEAILADESNPSRNDLFRMHQQNKPIFKKPRAPSKKKVSDESLWQRAPEEAIQRGRGVESTTEHEALHGIFDTIAQKHGQRASQDARQHVLGAFDPKTLRSIGDYIKGNGYKMNSPHFPEELLTHARDILVNPKKRQNFMNQFKTPEEAKAAIDSIKKGWKEAYKRSENLDPKAPRPVIDLTNKSESMQKGEPAKWNRNLASKSPGLHFNHAEHGTVSITKHPAGHFEVKHNGGLAGLKGQKGTFPTPGAAGTHAQNFMSALSTNKTAGNSIKNVPSMGKSELNKAGHTKENMKGITTNKLKELAQSGGHNPDTGTELNPEAIHRERGIRGDKAGERLISKFKGSMRNSNKPKQSPEDFFGKTESLEKSKNVRAERARVFGTSGEPNPDKKGTKQHYEAQSEALNRLAQKRYGMPIVESKGKMYTPERINKMRVKEKQPKMSEEEMRRSPEYQSADPRAATIDSRNLRPVQQKSNPKPDWRSGQLESQRHIGAKSHELGHLEISPEGVPLGDLQTQMDVGSSEVGKNKLTQGAAKQTEYELQPMGVEEVLRRRAGVPSHGRPQYTDPRRGHSAEPLTEESPPRISLDTKRPYGTRLRDDKGQLHDLVGQSKNISPENRQRIKDIDEGILKFHPHTGFYRETSPNATINLRGQGRKEEATALARKRHMGKSESLKKSKPLEKTFTPNPKAQEVMSAYAKPKGVNLNYNLTPNVNPERGKALANAYEGAKHEPSNPAVKSSYDALKQGTSEQFQHLLNNGLKISKIKPGQENPYKTSKDLFADIHNNNHMHYFPTESGFGSNEQGNDHPMLESSKFKHEGKSMPYNDIFRIAHDYVHHATGSSFGPRGEDVAYQFHKQLYPEAAHGALAAETRMQNATVNHGKNAEHNKANPHDTKFADQKATIAPDWAIKD